MQYNNFDLQITSDGCIIRDSAGKFVAYTETDKSAIELIDECIDIPTIQKSYNLYRQFERYCKKLPGKCYINDQLVTSNKKALTRFTNSFQKLSNTTINYTSLYSGGETFYTIRSIERN